MSGSKEVRWLRDGFRNASRDLLRAMSAIVIVLLALWSVTPSALTRQKTFSFKMSAANNFTADLEAAVVWMFGTKTIFDEARSEDRGECPANGVTECLTESACT